MKKLVTVALLCAMLLSCLAGLGIGVQAESALDGENPNANSGEDVVAIGYQIKQNGGDTYDLRLVLGMKDVFEGVGVEVDILSAEGEKSKATFVKTVYNSVKDDNNNVYAASAYGCDYLYVVVISDIPVAYTIANKQLQLTVTPFGANKVEGEIVVKNGSEYTVGKYADLWDGKTADEKWFDKNNPKSEYTLTTAEQFAGFIAMRQSSKGAISFDGITINLATDIIIQDGTLEQMRENHFIADSVPSSDKSEEGAAKKALRPKAVTALGSTYSFKGTFDGQGHTIYGVYLNCTGSGVKGLFGGLGDNAVITNLNIDTAYFSGTETDDKHTGGILASRANGKNILISNVTITNALMEEQDRLFSGVGLLIGKVDAGKSLTLENCHTSGTVSFPTKGTNDYGFGGIVGYVAASSSQTSNSVLVMKNCSSSANINATNIVGGLVGKLATPTASCSLVIYEDCKFTGTLKTNVAEGKTEYKGEYVSGVDNLHLYPTSIDSYTHQYPTTLAEGADMRVMSFNILCELWNTKAVIPGRELPVLASIYAYKPDILGLLEVSDGWYDVLEPFFASNGFYAIADKKTDQGVTNFSPLIYNTETMTLLEHGVETFSVGDERLRVLSWGYFERKSDGERFIAINTHWNVGDADDEQKTADQVTQATEMAEFVLAMKAKYNCPIITTGDYNNRYEEKFEPKEIPLKTYIDLSGMKDSREYAKVANHSYKTTHTLFTECHRWDGAAIDHIFVSSDVEVLFYNILIDDYQRYASDHNPIYADIKLK